MHRYYLTQRGVAPGCQPGGFSSFEETSDGELTNGKRCYGYIDYDRELTPEEISRYELTPHSDSVRLREYKTAKGWDEFAEKTGKGDFGEYCKPGDVIDEAMYNDFLNVLPPLTMRRGYFQVGEPFDHLPDKNGKVRATWPTFAYDGERYYYLGNCFAGERENIPSPKRF